MSLINQVLLDLEKRGAQVPKGEAAIRPVQSHESSHAKWGWLAAVLLLLVIAGAGYRLLFASRPAPVTPQPVAVMPVPVAPVSQAVSAPVVAEAVSAPVQAAPPALIQKPEKPLVALAPKRPAEDMASAPATGISKRIKPISQQQQSENEFHRGKQLREQGLVDEAVIAFESALQLDSKNTLARQSLISLLLENHRNAEAEQALQRALKEDASRLDEAMWLARLQVERKDVAAGLVILQNSLPFAEQRPDYQAFIAALYQRQEQHDKAITHYRKALQKGFSTGAWWVGMAISLQAEKRFVEARDAYKRALGMNNLNADLRSFAQARLKELP